MIPPIVWTTRVESQNELRLQESFNHANCRLRGRLFGDRGADRTDSDRDGISHGCDSSGVLACRARERCDPGTYSLAEYQARSAAGHTLRAGPRLPQPRSRIAPRSQNGRVTPPSVALVGIHSATPRRRVILAVLRLASIGNSITGSVLWKLDSQI